MTERLVYKEYKYGDANELQNLATWELAPGDAGKEQQNDEDKYWFIFIHGGAWRDPKVDLHSIEPTIGKLLASPSRGRIGGFASINYRLSRHPDYPQDRATTPSTQLRTAHHPDHVDDVAAGFQFLASYHPSILQNYILFGHSCGAFLAFQLLYSGLGPSSRQVLRIHPPAAIVGFQGIYDLRSLNERKGGAYTSLFAGAFGADEAVWDEAGPRLHVGEFREGWAMSSNSNAAEGGGGGELEKQKKRVAVIAHSTEDELVDVEEARGMEATLRWVEGEGWLRVLAFTDLRGKHDEVRIEGVYTARVLAQTIGALDEG